MAKNAGRQNGVIQKARMQIAGPLRYLGLRTQIMLFLLAIILATLGLILINSWQQFEIAREQDEREAEMLSTRVASSVLRVVDAQIGHLYLLGHMYDDKLFDAQDCGRKATDLLAFQKRYLVMGMSDMSGNVLCQNEQFGSENVQISDRAWFREILAGSASAFGTLIGRRSNKMVLVGGLRIDYANALPMVVFSSIDLEWIDQILEEEAKGSENMIVSLIDGRGQLLAHTKQASNGRALPEASAQLWESIRKGQRSVQAQDIDGVERKFFTVPVQLAGRDRFYIASGFAFTTPADDAKAVLSSLWGGYFVLTLVAVIVGFLLTEQMINMPLAKIISNLIRYENGERKVRIGPPYMRNEIGALGQALDQLADAVDTRDDELEARRHKMETLAQRLEAIIEASPVPIVWLTFDWRVQLWNNAAKKVFGFSAEETMGNAPPIVPQDQEAASRALLACVFRGDTIQDIDLKRRHKDGRILDVRASLAPLRNEEGKIDGCLVIFIDETERRQIEQQFVHAQKMEALGQLTGGLSHDFNNLLGVIIGNMDFLLDSLDEKPELKNFAQSALNAALQGAELNKRLLAFARRQPLIPQPIQIAREISNVTAMLRRAMGELYEVETDVEADIWTVLADPTQLHSALLNLGLNARDAMPGGGKLLIEARNRRFDPEMASAIADGFPPGDYVCVSVSDTGIGMSEAVLKRVFEPFFTTKEVGQGTGLGLSMVHGFARQSGGQVTVYSEEGNGTTFRLYLPRFGKGDTVDEQSETAGKMQNQKRLNVLLVEDNAGLRLVARQQLTMIGCLVVEAENAPAALKILESRSDIDLMLSDIVMPGGMNGRELAARAAQMHPNLKIILMSGYSDPRQAGDHHEEKEKGAWELLTKPFRRQELYEAIQRTTGQE